MCGIIGYTGSKKAMPVLMRGLKLLEYGATIARASHWDRRALSRPIRRPASWPSSSRSCPAPPRETAGIGHTRWATHGGPTDLNAHPHVGSSGRVSIAHNGIIDNHAALRRELEAEGVAFASETDSEVIAQLIEYELRNRADAGPEAAVVAALARLQGTFGLAILFAAYPGLVVGARNGSPLVLGIGEGSASSPWTPRPSAARRGRRCSFATARSPCCAPAPGRRGTSARARPERGAEPRRGRPPGRARREPRLAAQGDTRRAGRRRQGPWQRRAPAQGPRHGQARRPRHGAPRAVGPRAGGPLRHGLGPARGHDRSAAPRGLGSNALRRPRRL